MAAWTFREKKNNNNKVESFPTFTGVPYDIAIVGYWKYHGRSYKALNTTYAE